MTSTPLQPASLQPAPVSRRPFGQNYAFVVVAVIFLALLASAGLRATPGVLMLPLQQTFGWNVGVISSSAAIGIFLYGLAGPFAAAVMQRFGIRRTVLGALTLMAASTGASFFMTAPWQLFLTWGLLSGIGSGAVANVLGATIVNRWFTTNRGLVMGLLTANTATGTLIFMPGLAALVAWGGWRPVVLTVAACCAVLIPLVYFLVPERPASVGLRSFGSPHDDHPAPKAQGNPFTAAFLNLARAATTRAFWFLFATFFICGFTTNGLVGTHLIAFCGDHGIVEVQAASLLALMGFFDLFGTTLSGWLTDRFDPRKLLFFYYGLRGLSLIYLPYSDFSLLSLSVFAVFYGLDWIATVPPTVRIANEAFGDKNAPLVFGWVVAGHQLGAACAAFFAGFMRSAQGNYLEAFMIAGLTGIIAAVLSLLIARRPAQGVLAAA
ncbi:MFS transporter [Bradyrhizobium sp. ISRA443]|uniref:MFS transporter n=1 Tax=unclassified Bradyrhizobium TaxID=2631580 RepID=UPI0024792315|nr:MULTISPECIES: MFS transporter [unclassified Bradyrhizobium]WGR95572.1 MFS transporter [Bradyrhizobium sp. ISRA435]WGS00630.1 MFS transporter [Bradyrhizobium sp. ISRA436]WGS07518.1 MFS transporter [Bradyrhizobium sp. ISRA437]WGS14405.1 MFS transporter [Bradyrhizobium sp. ISRA443]